MLCFYHSAPLSKALPVQRRFNWTLLSARYSPHCLLPPPPTTPLVLHLQADEEAAKAKAKEDKAKEDKKKKEASKAAAKKAKQQVAVVKAPRWVPPGACMVHWGRGES